tara:strand:+ start:45770 stop:46669 length:900 start_codon:yes stop_codon:yes gene_type:complete
MPKTTSRPIKIGLLSLLPLSILLTGCSADYSPNTYKSASVQQASKVETGVVIGVRKVVISADTTVATATGATAGGIAGSQVAEGAVAALGALGGAVVGGIAGSEAGRSIQDTYGYEYILRNSKGELLSVTQKDTVPLKVGQRVLLIQGMQARIVNDYTEPVDTDLAAEPNKPPSPNEPKPDISHAKNAEAPPPADENAEPVKKDASSEEVSTEENVPTEAGSKATDETVVPAEEEPDASSESQSAPEASTSAATPATDVTPAPAASDQDEPATTAQAPKVEESKKPDASAPIQIAPTAQ